MEKIKSISRVDVFLQSFCLRKWFTTRFTFMLFMIFMNCDVLLQHLLWWKIFAAKFTFVAFMNCVDVSFQMIYSRKWFATRFTFDRWSFWAFVNYVNVLLQYLPWWKIFAAIFTFVIFVAFINSVNVFLQTCFKKWFDARVTFVVFPSMTSFNMYC